MHESAYYPAGAYSDPNAPYNQVDVPEKEFEVTCSQSLSRTAIVTTNDYIPGACGVDYEDDVDGCCACGWQDPDDTSYTDWGKKYNECGYTTPLQLIQMFKEYLERDLNNIDAIAQETKQNKTFLERKLKHLIAECDCWQDDETEYCVD